MALAGMRYLADLDERAVDRVLADWQAAYPCMGVLALLPEAEKNAVAGLQAVCARRKVPLMGAVFPALAEGEVFHAHGVWLLCFPAMPYVALHADLPRDAAGAARAAEAIASGVRKLGLDTGQVEGLRLGAPSMTSARSTSRPKSSTARASSAKPSSR